MAEAVRLLAAGSLSRAFAGLAPIDGRAIEVEYGPSGLLRAQIEAGTAWDVFASADTGHPARLHRAGLGTAPRLLCRNTLCLVVAPGLDGDAAALLRRPDLRVGISTPGNDPSGDYAQAALDRLGPGPVARALRLTGSPELPQPPTTRNVYAWILTSGLADMVLTYRSNARAARQDTAALRALDLPETLQVGAAYALTTRIGAGAAAERLAERLLARPMQARLAALGFAPPAATEPTAQGAVP